MQILKIEGGTRLEGTAQLVSAKNAVLPILAACVITDQPVTLLDVPDILDVENMLGILRELGCTISKDGKAVTVCAANIDQEKLPDHLAKLLRSSIFLMGPLLARMRKAIMPFPGGCEIGLRPIDLHQRGLESLGVVFHDEGGYIRCDGSHMRGGVIHFDFPSVGATENVMMAAALTPGKTVIHNAAREPEIVDLQRFMNACGAKVSGAGKPTITIQGVKRLHGATYRPIPDRIVGGTLLAAAAMTGGTLDLRNAPDDMGAIVAKMRDMGCEIREEIGRTILLAPKRLHSFRQMQTQPFPGFPTDMQAQMMALATMADGVSLVMENVFENRFAHAADLARMGADIVLSNRMAVIRGVPKLHGTTVVSRDLRAGAALVIAGLAAEGTTIVENITLIDRGYERLEDQLAALGAKIERVEEMNGQKQYD